MALLSAHARLYFFLPYSGWRGFRCFLICLYRLFCFLTALMRFLDIQGKFLLLGRICLGIHSSTTCGNLNPFLTDLCSNIYIYFFILFYFFYFLFIYFFCTPPSIWKLTFVNVGWHTVILCECSGPKICGNKICEHLWCVLGQLCKDLPFVKVLCKQYNLWMLWANSAWNWMLWARHVWRWDLWTFVNVLGKKYEIR